jgi:cytoskeletal protein CcmA (bactofilin family)
MKKHIFKGIILLPLVLMFVLLAATPAMAADLRSGDAVVISSGDVIDDDLYIAASSIAINGVVNGDVVSVGSTITVTGKINGSIIAIGSTINIGGEITESVRVVGSSVTVTGIIGGDLVTAVNDIDIDKSAVIQRDLVFAGREIDIDAPISEEITGWGSQVTIRDIVGGDVEIGVETLTIASTAEIKGDLVYYSEDPATIESGAKIDGTTTHEPAKYRMPDFPIIRNFRIWGAVIGFFMALIPGIIIILIAPRRSKAVAAAIKTKPLLSLGWGALLLIATPIAILILCVTIIGIPLGIIGVILYGLAIFFGQIAFGLFIGYWIIGSTRNVDSKGILILAFLLGFVLLTLVKLIPFVGPFIWIVTTIFGIGAMAISNKTMPSRDEPELIEAREE